MSAASTAASASSARAAAAAGRRKVPLTRGGVVAVALAAGAFFLAFRGGFYGLDQWGALAVEVWWALLLMVLLGLWPRSRVPPMAQAAGGLFAIFAALTALSTFWAPATETAVTEAGRALLYLGILGVAVLAVRPGDDARAADGLGLGIAAVSILALASRLFGDLAGPQEVSELLPGTETRLSYPVDYWNGLAILAALGLPLILHTATSVEAGRWRAVTLAAVPVLAAVVFLASSRGAAAVGAAGLLAFVALTDRRLLAVWAMAVAAGGSAAAIAVLHGRDVLVSGPLRSPLAQSQGRSAALLIALVCLATAAVYFLGVLRAPVRPPLPKALRAAMLGVACLGAVFGVVAVDPVERLERFKVAPSQDPVNDVDPKAYVESHLLSGGGSGRWQFWSAALDEFRAHPIRGGGAGSFESWWAANGSITYFIRDAHSLWLEILGELGIIGLLVLLAFFACIGLGAASALSRAPPVHRSARAALVAVMLAFCVGAAIDWMWELTVVGAVAMLAAGMLVGPACIRTSSAPRVRHPLQVPARAGVVAVGLPIIAMIALPLLSDLRLQTSRAEAKDGDPGAAMDAARSARSLAPWSSGPPTQLALLAEQGGDLAGARRWIDRALAENDADWRLWLVAARIQSRQGEIRAAARSLARARSLNPRSPLLMAGTGVLLPLPAVAPARGIETALTNAGPFMGSKGESSRALGRARKAGIGALRIYVSWAGTAPRQRPRSWNPANPADPNYFWYTDRQVRRAVAAGLTPILSVSDAPSWAERSTGGKPGTNSPDAKQLGRFMRAAAKRYSGATPGVPRVRYWQIWNEPNASYWLNPQRKDGRDVSPAIYRRMLNSSAAAVRAVSPRNRVVAGGTFPFQQVSPGPEAIAPRRFLRSLTRAKVQFDVWSVHPYTSGNAFHRASGPGGVSLGDLGSVRRDLDRLYGAGRIDSRGPPSLWITEFQWDSAPPDPKGVPVDLLTRWTSEAIYQAWRSGVSLFTWFQLRDDPVGRGFQGGLFARCNTGKDCYRPKPILRSFRFPFVAYRRGAGLLVWGRTPRGEGGTVTIEQRLGSDWVRLGIMQPSAGIFTGRLSPRGGGSVRARWRGQASGAFSLVVPPDRPGTAFFGS